MAASAFLPSCHGPIVGVVLSIGEIACRHVFVPTFLWRSITGAVISSIGITPIIVPSVISIAITAAPSLSVAISVTLMLDSSSTTTDTENSQSLFTKRLAAAVFGWRRWRRLGIGVVLSICNDEMVSWRNLHPDWTYGVSLCQDRVLLRLCQRSGHDPIPSSRMIPSPIYHRHESGEARDVWVDHSNRRPSSHRPGRSGRACS